MDFLMAIQIAISVPLLNADKNVTRACLIAKLIEVMFVAILVSKMEAGNKEFTQEFIEILGPLKHSDSGWD